MKLPSERLDKFNYNITRTINEARRNQELISIGDNQALRVIRNIRYERNPLSVKYTPHKLNELLKERKLASLLKSLKEMIIKTSSLTKSIDDMLFVPEYLSVVIQDKAHYLHMVENGLFINGHKYVRFMCSAGQARVNTVVFIREDFEKETKKRLQAGKKNVLLSDSKYNAYFALASSATYEIPRPKVLLIDDCEIEMNKLVDYISPVDISQKLHNKWKIDAVEKSLSFNLFDGCGAMSPEYAQKIADALEIDYLPSGACLRCSFVKGMNYTIDFKKYARMHGVTSVVDLYGVEQNIEDIDLVLTKSQFKLYNAYDSIEDYHRLCDENGIGWGVTRVTPKEDEDYFRSNYQFCQVLNLNDNDIVDLCAPTVEWFNKIMSGDIGFSLLYLLGSLSNKKDFDQSQVLKMTNDNIAKALILHPDMAKDEYVKRTIFHSINKKIRESYVGKLLLDGNFSVMIPDMYAFMQWMCGHNITGALKENQHYSAYWNKKNVNNVVAMRSPLTWRSEVNKLNLVTNKLTDDWFAYLTNGIVYNVWGLDCIIHADSDFDGDIVATTDNHIFFSKRYDDLPITYNKISTEKSKIIEELLYKADLRAFDSTIGKVTNDGTTLYEILAKYEGKTECKKQENELITRLKLIRKAQGDAIDKAKGIKVDKIPAYWLRRIKKTPEGVEQDYVDFLNELVADRKPYFFRYLYYKENKKYRQFIEKKNRYCSTVFKRGLDDILASNCRNEHEQDFLDNEYYKYVPLIDNGSVMNRICHHMERMVSETSVPKSYRTPLEVVRLMQSKDCVIDSEKMNKMFEIYKKYKAAKKKYKAEAKTTDVLCLDNDGAYRSIQQYFVYLRTLLYEISSNGTTLANLAVELCYIAQPNKSKDFAWNLLGDEIVNNIFENRSPISRIPILDDKGDIKYMGKYYRMCEVSFDSIK